MTSTRKTNTKRAATSVTGKFLTRNATKGRAVDSKTGRVVLFPTEPSRLGRKKIEHAVDRVISKK